MKIRSAFSALELSIALIIIGIIVRAVVSSTSLIKSSNIARAGSLTKASPVNSMEDLVLWYETSLPDSFLLSEAEDQKLISIWKDISNSQSQAKNATQSNDFNKPKYVINGKGDVPAIRFDGIDDYMLVNSGNGNFIANNNYTIFIVEKRNLKSGANTIIGGTDSSSLKNLYIGYSSNNSLLQSHNNHDLTIGISSVSEANIHSFKFSFANGMQYYLNGVLKNSDPSKQSAINSYSGFAIGQSFKASDNFSGDISEVIIFKRDLKSQERMDVEAYLRKKFSIS